MTTVSAAELAWLRLEGLKSHLVGAVENLVRESDVSPETVAGFEKCLGDIIGVLGVSEEWATPRYTEALTRLELTGHEFAHAVQEVFNVIEAINRRMTSLPREA